MTCCSIDQGHRKFRNQMQCSCVANTRAAPQLAIADQLWNESKDRSISATADLAKLPIPATGNQRREQFKASVEEINAYIAVRDVFLVEAEEVTTRARLDRLTIANEFVETLPKTGAIAVRSTVPRRNRRNSGAQTLRCLEGPHCRTPSTRLTRG